MSRKRMAGSKPEEATQPGDVESESTVGTTEVPSTESVPKAESKALPTMASDRVRLLLFSAIELIRANGAGTGRNYDDNVEKFFANGGTEFREEFIRESKSLIPLVWEE